MTPLKEENLFIQFSSKRKQRGTIMCEIKNQGIDDCLKRLIVVLNDNGFKTVASCCGHGKQPGNIALADGREFIIMPNYKSTRNLETKNKDIWPGIDVKVGDKP